MKKGLTIILATLGIFLVSCNGTGSSKEADKSTENKMEGETKMATIKMTKVDFLTKVHNYEKDMETWRYLGDKPAVIDFYADWCGPCKQIAPILEELATEYGDEIYIYKVDVDSEQELAGLFNIRSIPSMLFIPMEGQPQMAAGAAPKADLKRTIDQLLLGKDGE